MTPLLSPNLLSQPLICYLDFSGFVGCSFVF